MLLFEKRIDYIEKGIVYSPPDDIDHLQASILGKKFQKRSLIKEQKIADKDVQSALDFLKET